MKRVYEGRVFAVEVGRMPFPNGSEHDVAIVRHRPSVVLVPMLADGRVLLIRQYRPATNRVMWELPAGSIDADEPLEAAAVRECAEETGLALTFQMLSSACESASSPVLMVIANRDFYYQEYADPRAQLEAAGIGVVVAAARRELSMALQSNPNPDEKAKIEELLKKI